MILISGRDIGRIAGQDENLKGSVPLEENGKTKLKRNCRDVNLLGKSTRIHEAREGGKMLILFFFVGRFSE